MTSSGVVLYLMPGSIDFSGGDSQYFWRSSDGTRALLKGSGFGYSAVDGDWQSYAIDYKRLMRDNMPAPPAGFTLNQGTIAGLDVYASSRGADLDLDLTSVDVVGVTN